MEISRREGTHYYHNRVILMNKEGHFGNLRKNQSAYFTVIKSDYMKIISKSPINKYQVPLEKSILVAMK